MFSIVIAIISIANFTNLQLIRQIKIYILYDTLLLAVGIFSSLFFLIYENYKIFILSISTLIAGTVWLMYIFVVILFSTI